MPDAPTDLRREQIRLKALAGFGVMDTAPERAFEGIVRLATRLTGCPIGLVSFVDAGRQWFKARLNFALPETDLERSVCRFVLDETDLLVIPDLTADARTAANPLVTGEPGLRFYAGAPLRTRQGQALGSLCVLDTVPRPGGLDGEQADDLRALARQVMDQLELRRTVGERDAALERQGSALRQAGRLDVLAKASAALLTADNPAAVLGSILVGGAGALGFDKAFIFDVASDGRHLRLTHAVNVDAQERARVGRMAFGAPLCGIVAETGLPLIVSGLQVDETGAHATARALGFDAYAGFPVMSRGEIAGVLSFASTHESRFDADALSFFETLARLMSSVCERLDGEAELAETGAYWRSLFERLNEGFVVGEVVRDAAGRGIDWRFCEVNLAWSGLVGRDGLTVVGRTAREVFPDIEPEWIDDLVRVVDTGEPQSFLREMRTLGRWYDGHAFAIGSDRFAKIFLEVTDRVKADERRAAQVALGDRLRDLTSVPEMTRAASEIVGNVLGATRAGFGRLDPAIEHVEIEPDWTRDGIGSIAGRHRFSDFGDIAAVLRRGEPLVITDVLIDPRTRDAPSAFLELGIRSLVNMPVQDRGRVVAVFLVQDDKPRDWSAETLAFLRNVADRLEAGVARVQAEEQQRILNEEISHRLKNTLAMVLSIAGQTLRSVPDRVPVEAFERRIHALSAAHNVLLNQTWTAAPTGEIVSAVLGAAGHGDRVDASGPELKLGPRATLSLSLLLHELATNAAKHGSLSVPDGRVAVSWRNEGEGDEREVVFDWVERGGPVPAPPDTSRRTGFGSRLIRMGIGGSGGVDLRYPPAGFEMTARAPYVQLRGP